MHKLNIFLIGCGLVGILAMLFKPIGLNNWVAGIGLLFLAYIVFYPPE